MTVEQVVAKSNGLARTATDAERKSHSVGTKAQPEMEVALAYAQYSTGKYNFDSWFLFDPNKRRLICVYLDLKDPQLGLSLRDDLMTKYGQPTRSDNFLGKASTWFTEEDRISWQEMLGKYNIEYCSRRSQSGL